MSNFKILLLGSGGVGKTTFIKMLNECEFEKKYLSTVGNNIISINITTDNKNYIFNVLDTAGQEKYINSNDNYENQDACIVMFDVTHRISFKELDYYINLCDKKNKKNIPIMILANKVELKERKIFPKQINDYIEKLNKNRSIMYYEISCKTKYQVDKPFKWLLNELSNDNDNIKSIGNNYFDNNHPFDTDFNEIKDGIILDKLNDDMLNELLKNINKIDIDTVSDFNDVTEIHYNKFEFTK